MFMVTMKAFIFFLLLGMQGAAAVKHSLKYFYTGSSQVPNFPEFVVVGMVDDVQIVHYDSNTEKAEPKQDWIAKNTDHQYWESETEGFKVIQPSFKANIDTAKQRFNQTGVLESVLFFAAVCWGSGVKTADANRLNKLIKKAGSILGVKLENLEEVSERRMLKKLVSIMDNPSHPMHAPMMDHRSKRSKRLIAPKCRTDRHSKSFVPVEIRLFNSSSLCR